jgi:hypothetical protein
VRTQEMAENEFCPDGHIRIAGLERTQ